MTVSTEPQPRVRALDYMEVSTIWREKPFALLSRNALRATAYLKIPPDRVFEVGVQVEL